MKTVDWLIKRHMQIGSDPIKQQKDGREIATTVCNLCGQQFQNSRSLRKHMQNRHFNKLREEGQSTLHSFFNCEGEDKTADEVYDSEIFSIPETE